VIRLRNYVFYITFVSLDTRGQKEIKKSMCVVTKMKISLFTRRCKSFMASSELHAPTSVTFRQLAPLSIGLTRNHPPIFTVRTYIRQLILKQVRTTIERNSVLNLWFATRYFCKR